MPPGQEVPVPLAVLLTVSLTAVCLFLSSQRAIQWSGDQGSPTPCAGNFLDSHFPSHRVGSAGEHRWSHISPWLYVIPTLVLCSCLSDAPDVQKSEMPGKERESRQVTMSSSLLAAPGAPAGPFFHGGVQAPRVAMTSGLEIPHWLPQGMDTGL